MPKVFFNSDPGLNAESVQIGVLNSEVGVERGNEDRLLKDELFLVREEGVFSDQVCGSAAVLD